MISGCSERTQVQSSSGVAAAAPQAGSSEAPPPSPSTEAGTALPVDSMAPVNNASTTLGRVRDAQGMAVGATLGGAALAGAGLALAGGPLGAAIGGGIGLALGAYVGNQHGPLAYNLRSELNERANALRSLQGRLAARVDRAADWIRDLCHGENRPHRDPLTLDDLRAVTAGGHKPRQYDSYDSSRDIFAVYSREGQASDPYRFQVEMANLRAGAEHHHLDAYAVLDWGPATAPQGLPFGLQDSAAAEPWKMAVRIDHPSRAQVVLADGTPQAGALQDATFSTTFSAVGFQLDKAALRAAGWQDGQPLRVRILTTQENSAQVVDSLAARTDATARLEPGNLPRWDGRSIYSIVTDRFQDGDTATDPGTDPSNPYRFHGGDWQGVIDRLDYLEGLGVDALWLSCPYENDTDFFGSDGFHGYWPHDFGKAEPHFGDKAKLKELVEKAHARGMKVILDVVVNHTGYKHPFVTDPSKEGWFHREGSMAGLGQYTAEHGSMAGLPDFAQENPEVARYLTDVHREWIADTGVDGFRLDAVRHVPKTFTRQFDEEMHAAGGPGFFTVGEAYVFDSKHISCYQNQTIDSMFDFPLAYAIRRVFSENDRSLSERKELAGKVWRDNYREGLRVLRSTGGEKTTLLSRALASDDLYDNPRRVATMIDNHDMIRFMTDAEGDTRQVGQALAFLYGCRGIPTMYYGTEVGMEGITGANRGDMEWDRNPQLTEAVKELVHARKSSLALQIGTQHELHAGRHTYAFSRMRPEEEVVCVFNASDKESRVDFRLDRESCIQDGAVLRDMLSPETTQVHEGRVDVTIPARGYRFFRWQKPPVTP